MEYHYRSYMKLRTGLSEFILTYPNNYSCDVPRVVDILTKPLRSSISPHQYKFDIIETSKRLSLLARAFRESPSLRKHVDTLIIEEFECLYPQQMSEYSVMVDNIHNNPSTETFRQGFKEFVRHASRTLLRSLKKHEIESKECNMPNEPHIVQMLLFQSDTSWIFESLPNCHYLKIPFLLFNREHLSYVYPIFENVREVEISSTKVYDQMNPDRKNRIPKYKFEDRGEPPNKIHSEAIGFLNVFEFITVSLPDIEILYFNGIESYKHCIQEVLNNSRFTSGYYLSPLFHFVGNMCVCGAYYRLHSPFSRYSIATRFRNIVINVTECYEKQGASSYVEFYEFLNRFRFCEDKKFRKAGTIVYGWTCFADDYSQKNIWYQQLLSNVTEVSPLFFISPALLRREQFLVRLSALY